LNTNPAAVPLDDCGPRPICHPPCQLPSPATPIAGLLDTAGNPLEWSVTHMLLVATRPLGVAQ
jgi:hypothetical protein